MQIIIVGCGKVGRTLAEQLQEEESENLIVDEKMLEQEERIRHYSYRRFF